MSQVQRTLQKALREDKHAAHPLNLLDNRGACGVGWGTLHSPVPASAGTDGTGRGMGVSQAT